MFRSSWPGAELWFWKTNWNIVGKFSRYDIFVVAGLFLCHHEVHWRRAWGRPTGKNSSWDYCLAFLQALQWGSKDCNIIQTTVQCSMLNSQCWLLRPSWLWNETSKWRTRTTATSTSSSVSRSGNCSTAAAPKPNSFLFCPTEQGSCWWTTTQSLRWKTLKRFYYTANSYMLLILKDLVAQILLEVLSC